VKLSKILLVLIVCSIPPINGTVTLNNSDYSKTIKYIVKKTLGDSGISKEITDLVFIAIAAIGVIDGEFTNADVANEIKRVATYHDIKLDDEATIVEDYLQDYAWENYPAGGNSWRKSDCAKGGHSVGISDDGKNLVLRACNSSIKLNKCKRRCGGIWNDHGTLRCPGGCL